jgi:hypothetical protein
VVTTHNAISSTSGGTPHQSAYRLDLALRALGEVLADIATSARPQPVDERFLEGSVGKKRPVDEQKAAPGPRAGRSAPTIAETLPLSEVGAVQQ